LRRNFLEKFVDRGNRLIFDHLQTDGTPDRQFRPNQLFDFDILDAQIPWEESLGVDLFARITRELVYSHGVGSLSKEDSNFHPYHHYMPYYVQDAAYHNGIVWTWLAGKWIDVAAEYGLHDLAFQVTDNMAGQILGRGAVGTLSELVDAAPRPGEPEPRLSGTYSQAWSLAEFIRNFYQSYLGITVRETEPRTL